jgi:hypothetical protein
MGDKSVKENSKTEKLPDDKPQDDKPQDDKPQDDKPQDDKPQDDKPQDDQKFDDKLYDKIVNEKNIDVIYLQKGFKIVEQFIRDRGLVLYGGMAIDFALRLKNSSIYAEDAIPDYDMFSPDSVKDSYDLTEIFRAAGMQNAKSVVGLYVRAMKNSVSQRRSWVADIAYIPSNIFKQLPTLVYKGMKIIHPHYQMVDMHQAMSAPFQSPTMGEPIFGRISKDITRYNIFVEKYPLGTVDMRKIDRSKQSEVQIRYLGEMLVGFPAYGAMLRKFKEVAVEMVAKFPEMQIPKDLFELRFEHTNSKLQCEVFNKEFTIIHSNVKAYLNTIVELSTLTPVYFNAFLNILPKKIQFNYRNYLFTIYDTSQYLIAKSSFTLGGMLINVASIQYQLKIMLANYIFESDPNMKNIYLACYTSLIRMINFVELFFKNVSIKNTTNHKSLDLHLQDAILNSPWMFPIEAYGGNGVSNENLCDTNERDQINIYKIEKALGRDPLPIDKIPMSYNPDKDRPADFDYSKSKFFAIDGVSNTV